MLVAPARPKTPEGDWQTILGAQFLFAPIDRPMLMRARRAAREASQAEDAEEVGSPIDMIEEMGDAMSRALIMDGMKGWRDVAAAALDDDGEPRSDNDGEPVFHLLPFTPENLALILSDPVTFEAIDNAYVVPFILRERERTAPGNALSASPNGIGEAATPAKDIATSPAKRSGARGAGSARTPRKSRGPSKKRTSGAS